MNIVIHVSKHYDWEPLPADVEPTDADIKSLKVKPDGRTGWLMKVTKDVETQTCVGLGELEIIYLIIGDMARDHVIHTRKQAIALCLTRHIMPHHAHRSWMTSVEVDDSGPEEDAFRKVLTEHIVAGNIAEEDEGELLAAYLEPAEAGHHADHLTKHFKMKPATTSKGKK